MTDLARASWFLALTDELNAMLTEKRFNLATLVIESRWELGKIIAENKDYARHSRGNGALLGALSEAIEISESTIYRSIQFYTANPDLEKFLSGYGKNISWSWIVANLLGDGHPEAEEHIALERETRRLLSCSLSGLNEHTRHGVEKWRAEGRGWAAQVMEARKK